MSKAELIKSWNEFVSLSERDFRNVKIGTKYVRCIEYIAYDYNSPYLRKSSLAEIEDELNQLEIVDEMNKISLLR